MLVGSFSIPYQHLWHTTFFCPTGPPIPSVSAEVEETIEADEGRIEAMLDLEEELADRHRKAQAREAPSTDEETETDDESVSRTLPRPVTGTIRSVRPSFSDDDSITITYLVDGSEEIELMSKPERLDDEDEELVRLCRLCDVDPHRVADLQGCSVPVTRKGDRHHLHVPTQTNAAALAVFRAWWWRRENLFLDVRRRISNVSHLAEPVGATLLAGVWLVSGYLAVVAWQAGIEDLAHVLPYVTGGALSGLFWEVLGGLLALAFIITLPISVLAILFFIYIVALTALAEIGTRVWPF